MSLRGKIRKLNALAQDNPNVHEAEAARTKAKELERLIPRRGNGRVFLRGRVFWIAYFLRGKEYRESGQTADPKQAEKFLRHRLKEVGADQLNIRAFTTPQASRLTIGELTAALRADFELRGKWSAQNGSHLRRVERDFGHARAVALTAEQIDKYIEMRLADGDAKATVNRTLQMLGQCYALAIRRKHLSQQPFIRHLPEAGNVRKGFLSPADFAKVLAALPADGLNDFCQWAYITGQRKGEVSKLTWSMVDGDELHIPGDITKNREPRTLPLVGELAAIVERRRSARRVERDGVAHMAEFIFHRHGEHVGEFRKSWRTACQAAGIGGRIFHDLRRSAVKNLTKAGTPQAVAMKVSGHQTASMFRRYNIVESDDVRTALERTEQYRATAAKQKVVAMR